MTQLKPSTGGAYFDRKKLDDRLDTNKLVTNGRAFTSDGTKKKDNLLIND